MTDADGRVIACLAVDCDEPATKTWGEFDDPLCDRHYNSTIGFFGEDK